MQLSSANEAHLTFVNFVSLVLHDVLSVVYFALDDEGAEPLLMTLHLGVLLYLRNSNIFFVPKQDDLIEGKNELKGRFAYSLIVERRAILGHLQWGQGQTYFDINYSHLQ